MRLWLCLACLLATGCQPGVTFNDSVEMSPDQMLQRADLVFVGVIERQDLDRWPVLIPGRDVRESRYWRKLRRSVRVELVLRGKASSEVIQVVEVFWQGGTMGDWNATDNGMRALFLVRKEAGQYHVVRDWWRSIFPVTSGRHTKLPLGEGTPLWERIGLMNYWVERGDAQARMDYPYFHYHDPAAVLTPWRIFKLLRGLMRHPSPWIRMASCRQLLSFHGWGQDECWESLTLEQKEQMRAGGHYCCNAEIVAESRRNAALQEWDKSSLETRRLMTTINNRKLREKSCSLWAREHADDADNGCPADQPPPATIVTASGDVPLRGNWPE